MVEDSQEDKQVLTELTPEVLANRLGIRYSSLTWLNKFSKIDLGCAKEGDMTPYTRKEVTTGSKIRKVYAPHRSIRAIQHRLRATVWNHIEPGEFSMAYETGMNLKESGVALEGNKVVIGLDFKDFFHSITRKHVYATLINEGYPEDTARVIANLSCVRDKWWHLPQGGITSGNIANRVAKYYIDPLVVQVLDAECGPGNYRYVRYSDNIYVGLKDNLIGMSILKKVKQKLWEDGKWRTHKERVLPYYRRQSLLGMVVNERTTISSQILRRFSSAMYNIAKSKDAAEARQSLDRLSELGVNTSSINTAIRSLSGKVAYFTMVVCDQKASKLKEYLTKAIERLNTLCLPY